MNTKYPIILVHGIVVKDTFFFKSFGRIDKELTNNGFTVYKSKIDGVGSVENNAEALKNEIIKIINETGCEKVNIIAHSKGGLDTKYMIENFDMDEYVASVTTLSTPYKGSPIASWILKWPLWILKFIAFWINFWYRIFGDKKPDSLKACQQLARVESLETGTLNISDKIYCRSYSSTMKKSRDDFVMGIPLLFSHYYEKGTDSDGMVPKDSAMFANYKGEAIEDSVSHSEIIDFMVKKKKREKIFAFYNMVCEDLANRGF